MSISVLVLTPFALLWTWVDATFTSTATPVPTTVVLDGNLVDVATHETSDGQLATAPDGVAIEVVDRTAVFDYYRTEELVAVAICLAILLVAVIAVATLLRRPASRVVAASFVLLGLYFVYAAFAGPAAREAGERRIIELLDLPTTDAQFTQRGFAVEAGLTEWHAWHSVLGALAIAAFGAAIWVLHLRRATQLAGSGPRAVGS